MIEGEAANLFNPAAPNRYVLPGLTGTSIKPYDYYIDTPYGQKVCWAVVAYSATGAAFPASVIRSFTVQRDPMATEGFEVDNTNGSTSISEFTQALQGGTNYWTINSTQTTYNRTPRTGSFNATLYNSGTGGDTWLFKAVNLYSFYTYDIEFYARQDVANTAYASAGIYYGTSPTIAGMTNVIKAQTGLTSGTYQRVFGRFILPADGVYYIGIHGYINNTAHYLSLDDITLSYAPAPNPVTLNLPASQAIYQSVLPTFSWTAPVSGTTPTSYRLQIDTSNPPNYGYEFDWLTSTSYTMTTPLEYGTTYYWRVTSLCNGPSENNEIRSFTTAPRNALAEGFEAGVIPDNWTVINADNGSQSWITTTINPHTGTYAASANCETDRQADDWLITPPLKPSININDPISFWLGKNNAAYPEEWQVLVSTTTTLPAAFTMIDSGTLSGTAYERKSYDLDAYPGGYVYLAIRYRGTNEHSLFVDDFLGPQANQANDLAAVSITGTEYAVVGQSVVHTITVKNNDIVTHSGYTVYLKRSAPEQTIASFVMPALAAASTATHTFSWIPDLSFQGLVNLYCEVVMDSDSFPENNLTAALPFSAYPVNGMFEGFESGIPSNWTVLNADGGDETWHITSNPFHTGNYAAQVTCESWDSGIESDDWLITPPLQLSLSHPDQIGFFLRTQCDVWDDPWQVLISTTDTNPASFTMIDSGDGQLGTFTYKTYNLDSYGNAVIYLAIRYIGLRNDNFFVDDFAGPPVFVTAVNAPVMTIGYSGSDVTLNWNAIAGASEYHIYTSDDLITWSPTYTTVTAPTLTHTFSSVGVGKQFFKVTASTGSTRGVATIPDRQEKLINPDDNRYMMKLKLTK